MTWKSWRERGARRSERQRSRTEVEIRGKFVRTEQNRKSGRQDTHARRHAHRVPDGTKGPPTRPHGRRPPPPPYSPRARTRPAHALSRTAASSVSKSSTKVIADLKVSGIRDLPSLSGRARHNRGRVAAGRWPGVSAARRGGGDLVPTHRGQKHTVACLCRSCSHNSLK